MPVSREHVGTTERAADLRTYLRVVWKRRWSSTAVLLVTVASAVVFTSVQEPLFQAAATVLIEPEAPRVVSIQDLTPTSASQDYYATQYKLMESRPIVEGMIRRLRLKERIPAVGGAADPYFSVLSRLSVVPMKNTRLVQVAFENPDPVLAAEVANGVANEFVRYNLELKHQVAQDAVVWLNEQLSALRTQTQQSSKALQAYRARADLLGLKEQGDLARQKLLDVNRAYLEAQNHRLSLESKLRELSRVTQDPKAAETIFIVADDPLIRKLKTEASDLQIERAKLAQISKEKHPDLQQIDAQLRQVNVRLHAEIQKMLRAIETEYKVAKAREETLLGNVNELRKETRKLSERETQALSLQSEKDSNEEVQAAVLKRLKETGLATALDTTNVRVVEPAVPPILPAKPRKQLIWVLSVVSGLVLGIGMAFVAESVDNRVRTPADVERVVALPILGVVPVFEARRHR